MTDIVLPGFGMGMTDGTIIAWHKAVGDPVRQGEPLCDVEAAKTTVEVDATRDGFIQQLLIAPGTNVAVGSVIAVIGDTALAREEIPVLVSPPPAVTPVAPVPPPSVSPRVRPSQRRQVEPRARKAARLHGIDIETVVGSGPGKRVVVADVLCAVQNPAPVAGSVSATAAPAASAGIIRQLRMRCDGAPLAALLEELSHLDGPAIRLGAVLARAAALALVQAGVEQPLIALRTDDDTLVAVEYPLRLSARALSASLFGPPTALPDQSALVIETPCEDWLDEAVSIDPACPAALAIGNSAGSDWLITLTMTEAWHGSDTARRFLKALRDLLENPLAILA